MGVFTSRRGGVFEVIQSHSDSLYRRVIVGTGSWSRSRRATVHLKRFFWEKKRQWKLHRRLKKRPPPPPADDFCEIIQRDDCDTRTTNKRNRAIQC